jgi:hypothetical protein
VLKILTDSIFERFVLKKASKPPGIPAGGPRISQIDRVEILYGRSRVAAVTLLRVRRRRFAGRRRGAAASRVDAQLGLDGRQAEIRIRELLHDLARRDQPAKALLVGERVTGPDRPARPSRRRRPQHVLAVSGAHLGQPLLQPDTVRQGGGHVHEVEPPRQHRHYRDRHAQDRREPELHFRHGLGQRTDVRTSYHVVVKVVHYEVEGERAPDHDVVEHRPVERVQCDLGGVHDHQDRRRHAAEQHVVGEALPVRADGVVVGACQRKQLSSGGGYGHVSQQKEEWLPRS